MEAPLDLADLDPDELSRSIRRTVARALAEDLGDRGDLTSLVTVPPGTTGTAELVARGAGTVAGVAVVAAVFAQVDARVEVDLTVADGDRVSRGDVLGTVRGPLRSILTGERTALNLLCRLSGIATLTRAYVDAVAGTGCAVRDTRKTTPGLRLLEKAAVRAGGGHNHRIGLHDAILVKDNHIAAAGSLTAAAEAALRRDDVHVQVEVADLEQLQEALDAGVTDILLDNFSPEQLRRAVQRVEGRAALEASGAITLEDVRQYAATGVGRVAIGAITHSAPVLDIALDVRTDTAPPEDQPPSIWARAGDVTGGPAGDRDPAVEVTDERRTAGTPSPEEGAARAAVAAVDQAAVDQAAVDDAADDEAADGDDEPAAAAEPSSDDGLFAWRERQLGASDGRD